MHFRRVLGEDGVVVARATYVNALSPPEIFDDYMLNFADEGRCEVFVRGTTVRLARGDLQWRLPGDLRIVQRSYSSVIKRRSVLISRKALETTLVEMGHPSSVLLVNRPGPFRDVRAVQDLDVLFAAVKSTSSQLAQQTAYHDLVSALCDVVGSPSGERMPSWPEHRRVRMVKHYIDACYAEDTSLDALAALVDLDKYYLIRAFRRAVGIPPHKYRTHVRVARARHLLASGSPISCVALEVGFSSQARFHAAFLAIVGVTPGRYLRHVNGVSLEAPLRRSVR
jgi:AraC-like DNA-binding protein